MRSALFFFHKLFAEYICIFLLLIDRQYYLTLVNMVHNVKLDLMVRMLHGEDLAEMWSRNRQITELIEELDLIKEFSAWSRLYFAKALA